MLLYRSTLTASLHYWKPFHELTNMESNDWSVQRIFSSAVWRNSKECVKEVSDDSLHARHDLAAVFLALSGWMVRLRPSNVDTIKLATHSRKCTQPSTTFRGLPSYSCALLLASDAFLYSEQMSSWYEIGFR